MHFQFQFQFQSLADFIAMGGHGSYVWSCYLFTGFALALLTYWPSLKKQQLVKQIERRQRLDSKHLIETNGRST